MVEFACGIDTTSLHAEPRSDGIPFPPLRDLWYRIIADRQVRHLSYPQGMEDLKGLLRALQSAGIVDRDIRFPLEEMSVQDLVVELRARACVSPGFNFRCREEFKPGPLFDEMSDEPSEFLLRTISYDDYGDQIAVFCGENTPPAPGIPGTDRVLEDWIPFVDRWTKDPDAKWIDPETGKGYGLLDLAWRDTLGAGRCALTISHPGYLNPSKTAQLLSDITGQPFRSSYCHL